MVKINLVLLPVRIGLPLEHAEDLEGLRVTFGGLIMFCLLIWYWLHEVFTMKFTQLTPMGAFLHAYYTPVKKAFKKMTMTLTTFHCPLYKDESPSLASRTCLVWFLPVSWTQGYPSQLPISADLIGLFSILSAATPAALQSLHRLLVQMVWCSFLPICYYCPSYLNLSLPQGGLSVPCP